MTAFPRGDRILTLDTADIEHAKADILIQGTMIIVVGRHSERYRAMPAISMAIRLPGIASPPTSDGVQPMAERRAVACGEDVLGRRTGISKYRLVTCGCSGDVNLNAATQGDAPRENRSRPKLLLVDEPGVGQAPLMVRELSRTLRDIHREGVAILLVEQNAAIALALASGGYLLETAA